MKICNCWAFFPFPSVRFSYTYYEKKHGPIYKSIEALDRMGMEIIETGDPDSFKWYLQEYENTICGRHPISVFLHVSILVVSFIGLLKVFKWHCCDQIWILKFSFWLDIQNEILCWFCIVPFLYSTCLPLCGHEFFYTNCWSSLYQRVTLLCCVVKALCQSVHYQIWWQKTVCFHLIMVIILHSQKIFIPLPIHLSDCISDVEEFFYKNKNRLPSLWAI